jgi:uncharacterized Zn finger protein (UPF0148 family)
LALRGEIGRMSGPKCPKCGSALVHFAVGDLCPNCDNDIEEEGID